MTLTGDGATSRRQNVPVTTIVYHVSPSANRESIRRFGLDWRRMGTDRNIPGAYGAEEAGIFLSRDHEEARWFVDMGRRLHADLDVWEVTLGHHFDAYDPPSDVPCRDVNGYLCWTQPIESARVRLLSSRA